jgi:hypothetical protein
MVTASRTCAQLALCPLQHMAASTEEETARPPDTKDTRALIACKQTARSANGCSVVRQGTLAGSRTADAATGALRVLPLQACNRSTAGPASAGLQQEHCGSRLCRPATVAVWVALSRSATGGLRVPPPQACPWYELLHVRGLDSRQGPRLRLVPTHIPFQLISNTGSRYQATVSEG